MKKKIIAAFTALCLGATMFAGCGASEEGTSKNETVQSEENADGASQDECTDGASQEGSADLSGTLTLAGSTSMEKLCEAMSESFMQANPGVTVTVEYTGSGAGLESLAAGSVDIGNASRGLKDEEAAGGSVENVVAIDGHGARGRRQTSGDDVHGGTLARTVGAKESVNLSGFDGNAQVADGNVIAILLGQVLDLDQIQDLLLCCLCIVSEWVYDTAIGDRCVNKEKIMVF